MEPIRTDDLEPLAIEIASKHLLERWTLKELAARYHRSPATLHRRIAKWLDEERFSLVDRFEDRATPRIESLDNDTAERLASRSKLWRAVVGVVNGAEAARTGDYLKQDGSADAHKAFEGQDRLHEALGDIAADYMATRLRRNMTIGVASGRGVGFTVMALAELARNKPSWLAGYGNVRIESLCGGARVGAWTIPTVRALDADENVFQLASVLKAPRGNVHYMRGWISGDRAQAAERSEASSQPLDLALVGLEVLNTRHQFFVHHDQNVQLGAIAQDILVLKTLQQEDPTLVSSVAGIGHNLFCVGDRDYPPALRDAVRRINAELLAVPPARVKSSKEVLMVAGGAQKVEALAHLLAGRCPDAPVNLDNLVLVTDQWTAEQVLRRL